MYTKILAATDLTDTSLPAIQTALDLGVRLGAEVHVVFVLEAPYESRSWFAPFPAKQADLLRSIIIREKEAAERVLEEHVGKIKGSRPEHVALTVHVGTPSEAIPMLAKELGADLIVMRTHGRQGLAHALIGSIAERVIRTAPCAVLTVRAT